MQKRADGHGLFWIILVVVVIIFLSVYGGRTTDRNVTPEEKNGAVEFTQNYGDETTVNDALAEYFSSTEKLTVIDWYVIKRVITYEVIFKVRADGDKVEFIWEANPVTKELKALNKNAEKIMEMIE